jgi:hypothetical protein
MRESVMKKPLIIPKYMIRELERAAYYSRKSRECTGFFEKWIEKSVGNFYSHDEQLDLFKSLDELTVIKYGGEVNTESLENTLNNWIDANPPLS